ncbi:MAG: MarR family transcriptional regulator [Frankiales bacterium]|nr:MarR family transcriptional regulator [Frankiales bacterium]
MGRTPTDEEYARLLAFRTQLRQFQHWSEERAQAAGLSAAQHQLLLAIRGHRDPRGPTVGEVADYLLVRHHTAGGLIDRAQARGLVTRRADPADHRVVRLSLTADGLTKLDSLTEAHLQELVRLSSRLSALAEGETPP